ncbi:MAG: hypothetical protein ACLTXI_00260 [Collinsella sp.]
MINQSKYEPLSIRANMAWNAIGSVVNLGCQWLISILVVRLSTGFDDAGLYSLAVAIFGVFSPISQYRMYTIQISDTTGENTLGEYLSFRLLTNAIAFVLLIAYAVITVSPYAVLITIVYSIYRLLALTIDVFHACDQSNHRMDFIGKSLILQGLLSVIGFSTFYYFSHNLVVTFILLAFLMAAIGLIFDYPRTTSFEHLKLGISWSKARHLLIRYFPIVIAAVAASSAASLPRQILASHFGDSYLGIYASAAAPVAIIQMGASYIYNPLLSYFAESYNDKNDQMFRSLMFRCIAGMTCVCFFSMLELPVSAKRCWSCFTERRCMTMCTCYTPLIILAVLTGFMWFMNDLLISIRVFRGAFCGSVIAIIASAVAFPLILVFDMNGVTFVCIVSALASIAGMAIFLLMALKSHFV